ncbi:MAG: DUF1254 domain-containing protein [Actinobacteria bacterium]|nr:MAG: DUF1254 domain-containing protein [Actinomycetota bacterium]
MKKVLKWLGIVVLALVVLVGLLAALPPGRALISEKLTLKRGADAYLIGYPLVTMERTRESLTADGTGRPNAFTHARYLPTATNGVNVVAPSRDTVYSSAWLDLRDGPVLIEQPDMDDRFWLMPVLDQWTNVIADPGTRTVGNGPHTFLITGPDWTGEAPDEVIEYRSPTNTAWAILRMQTGPGLDAIADLQDGFRIAPMADPTAYTEPTVLTAPRNPVDVRSAVDALGAEAFFAELAAALDGTSFNPADPDAEATLERIGVTAGSFDVSALSEAQRAGLADVPGRVLAGMDDAVASGEGGRISNGWRIPPMILGDYGTQYPVRAVVAREGLGANLPEDAVYASTTVDADDRPLEGGKTYRIDMPADMPVKAFWSVTAYDERGNLLRGADEGLTVSGTAESGAQTIVISPEEPADGPWLRAPDSGRYRLLMRLYWPEPEVLDGQWAFPAVQPN